MTIQKIVTCDSCDQSVPLMGTWNDDLPKGWEHKKDWLDDAHMNYHTLHLCPDCIKTADRYDEWKKSQKKRKKTKAR